MTSSDGWLIKDKFKPDPSVNSPAESPKESSFGQAIG